MTKLLDGWVQLERGRYTRARLVDIIAMMDKQSRELERDMEKVAQANSDAANGNITPHIPWR